MQKTHVKLKHTDMKCDQKKKKKTVKKIKEPCGTHIFNYQLLESLLLAHNSNILLMKFKI